jgi:hypothetical protein
MNHIRLDCVPAMIEHLWNVVKNATADRAKWLENADRETNPEVKASWEKLAETELELAHACQSDADELLAQFRAAGGEMHSQQ